jgi:hypothetical protein
MPEKKKHGKKKKAGSLDKKAMGKLARKIKIFYESTKEVGSQRKLMKGAANDVSYVMGQVKHMDDIMEVDFVRGFRQLCALPEYRQRLVEMGATKTLVRLAKKCGLVAKKAIVLFPAMDCIEKLAAFVGNHKKMLSEGALETLGQFCEHPDEATIQACAMGIARLCTNIDQHNAILNVKPLNDKGEPDVKAMPVIFSSVLMMLSLDNLLVESFACMVLVAFFKNKFHHPKHEADASAEIKAAHGEKELLANKLRKLILKTQLIPKLMAVASNFVPSKFLVLDAAPSALSVTHNIDTRRCCVGALAEFAVDRALCEHIGREAVSAVALKILADPPFAKDEGIVHGILSLLVHVTEHVSSLPLSAELGDCIGRLCLATSPADLFTRQAAALLLANLSCFYPEHHAFNRRAMNRKARPDLCEITDEKKKLAARERLAQEGKGAATALTVSSGGVSSGGGSPFKSRAVVAADGEVGGEEEGAQEEEREGYAPSAELMAVIDLCRTHLQPPIAEAATLAMANICMQGADAQQELAVSCWGLRWKGQIADVDQQNRAHMGPYKHPPPCVPALPFREMERHVHLGATRAESTGAGGEDKGGGWHGTGGTSVKACESALLAIAELASNPLLLPYFTYGEEGIEYFDPSRDAYNNVGTDAQIVAVAAEDTPTAVVHAHGESHGAKEPAEGGDEEAGGEGEGDEGEGEGGGPGARAPPPPKVLTLAYGHEFSHHLVHLHEHEALMTEPTLVSAWLLGCARLCAVPGPEFKLKLVDYGLVGAVVHVIHSHAAATGEHAVELLRSSALCLKYLSSELEVREVLAQPAHHQKADAAGGDAYPAAVALLGKGHLDPETFADASEVVANMCMCSAQERLCLLEDGAPLPGSEMPEKMNLIDVACRMLYRYEAGPSDIQPVYLNCMKAVAALSYVPENLPKLFDAGAHKVIIDVAKHSSLAQTMRVAAACVQNLSYHTYHYMIVGSDRAKVRAEGEMVKHECVKVLWYAMKGSERMAVELQRRKDATDEVGGVDTETVAGALAVVATGNYWDQTDPERVAEQKEQQQQQQQLLQQLKQQEAAAQAGGEGEGGRDSRPAHLYDAFDWDKRSETDITPYSADAATAKYCAVAIANMSSVEKEEHDGSVDLDIRKHLQDMGAQGAAEALSACAGHRGKVTRQNLIIGISNLSHATGVQDMEMCMPALVGLSAALLEGKRRELAEETEEEWVDRKEREQVRREKEEEEERQSQERKANRRQAALEVFIEAALESGEVATEEDFIAKEKEAAAASGQGAADTANAFKMDLGKPAEDEPEPLNQAKEQQILACLDAFANMSFEELCKPSFAGVQEEQRRRGEADLAAKEEADLAEQRRKNSRKKKHARKRHTFHQGVTTKPLAGGSLLSRKAQSQLGGAEKVGEKKVAAIEKQRSVRLSMVTVKDSEHGFGGGRGKGGHRHTIAPGKPGALGSIGKGHTKHGGSPHKGQQMVQNEAAMVVRTQRSVHKDDALALAKPSEYDAVALERVSSLLAMADKMTKGGADDGGGRGGGGMIGGSNQNDGFSAAPSERHNKNPSDIGANAKGEAALALGAATVLANLSYHELCRPVMTAHGGRFVSLLQRISNTQLVGCCDSLEEQRKYEGALHAKCAVAIANLCCTPQSLRALVAHGGCNTVATLAADEQPELKHNCALALAHMLNNRRTRGATVARGPALILKRLAASKELPTQRLVGFALASIAMDHTDPRCHEQILSKWALDALDLLSKSTDLQVLEHCSMIVKEIGAKRSVRDQLFKSAGQGGAGQKMDIFKLLATMTLMLKSVWDEYDAEAAERAAQAEKLAVEMRKQEKRDAIAHKKRREAEKKKLRDTGHFGEEPVDSGDEGDPKKTESGDQGHGNQEGSPAAGGLMAIAAAATTASTESTLVVATGDEAEREQAQEVPQTPEAGEEKKGVSFGAVKTPEKKKKLTKKEKEEAEKEKEEAAEKRKHERHRLKMLSKALQALGIAEAGRDSDEVFAARIAEKRAAISNVARKCADGFARFGADAHSWVPQLSTVALEEVITCMLFLSITEDSTTCSHVAACLFRLAQSKASRATLLDHDAVLLLASEPICQAAEVDDSGKTLGFVTGAFRAFFDDNDFKPSPLVSDAVATLVRLSPFCHGAHNAGVCRDLCTTFLALSTNIVYRREMIQAGAVKGLLFIAQAGDRVSKAQARAGAHGHSAAAASGVLVDEVEDADRVDDAAAVGGDGGKPAPPPASPAGGLTERVVRMMACAMASMSQENSGLSKIFEDGGLELLRIIAAFEDEETWLYCSESFALISGFPKARAPLMAKGSTQIITIIQNTCELRTECNCVVALGNLSAEAGTNGQRRYQLLQLGAVAACCRLLKVSTSFEVQRYAAICLANLSKDERCWPALLEPQCWGLMWRLLRFSNSLMRRQCAVFFSSLSGSAQGAELLSTPKGLHSLLNMGIASLHEVAEYRDTAVAIYTSYAVSNLADADEEVVELLLNTPFPRPPMLTNNFMIKAGDSPPEPMPAPELVFELEVQRVRNEREAKNHIQTAEELEQELRVEAATRICALGRGWFGRTKAALRAKEVAAAEAMAAYKAEMAANGEDDEDEDEDMFGSDGSDEEDDDEDELTKWHNPPSEGAVLREWGGFEISGSCRQGGGGGQTGIGEHDHGKHKHKGKGKDKEGGSGSGAVWSPLPEAMDLEIKTTELDERVLVVASISRSSKPLLEPVKENMASTSYRLVVDGLEVGLTTTGDADKGRGVCFHGLTAPLQPGVHSVSCEFLQWRGEVLWPHEDDMGEQVRRLAAIRVAPQSAESHVWGGSGSEGYNAKCKGGANLWNPLPQPMAGCIKTTDPGEHVLALAEVSRTQHDTSKVNTMYRMQLTPREDIRAAKLAEAAAKRKARQKLINQGKLIEGSEDDPAAKAKAEAAGGAPEGEQKHKSAEELAHKNSAHNEKEAAAKQRKLEQEYQMKQAEIAEGKKHDEEVAAEKAKNGEDEDEEGGAMVPAPTPAPTPAAAAEGEDAAAAENTVDVLGGGEKKKHKLSYLDEVVCGEASTGDTKRWNFRPMVMAGMIRVQPGEHKVEVQYKTQEGSAQWPHDIKGQQARRLSLLRLQGPAARLRRWGEAGEGPELEEGASRIFSPLPTQRMWAEYTTTTPGSLLFVHASLSRVCHSKSGEETFFRIVINETDEAVMVSAGDIGRWRYGGVTLMGVALVPPGTHRVEVEYMTSAGKVKFEHESAGLGSEGLGVQCRQLYMVEVSPYEGLSPGGVLENFDITEALSKEVGREIEGEPSAVAVAVSGFGSEGEEAPGEVAGGEAAAAIAAAESSGEHKEADGPVGHGGVPIRQKLQLEDVEQGLVCIEGENRRSWRSAVHTRIAPVREWRLEKGPLEGLALQLASVEDRNDGFKAGVLGADGSVDGYGNATDLDAGNKMVHWANKGLYVRRDHVWYRLGEPCSEYKAYYEGTKRRCEISTSIALQIAEKEFDPYEDIRTKAAVAEQELLECRDFVTTRLGEWFGTGKRNKAAKFTAHLGMLPRGCIGWTKLMIDQHEHNLVVHNIARLYATLCSRSVHDCVAVMDEDGLPEMFKLAQSFRAGPEAHANTALALAHCVLADSTRVANSGVKRGKEKGKKLIRPILECVIRLQSTDSQHEVQKCCACIVACLSLDRSINMSIIQVAVPLLVRASDSNPSVLL